MMILSIFSFLIGVYMYCFLSEHLLSVLISLEYMGLGLFLMMYYYLNLFSFEQFFSMMFMIMVVCEGALGLSIMVLMVRMFSNDYLNSLFILKC